MGAGLPSSGSESGSGPGSTIGYSAGYDEEFGQGSVFGEINITPLTDVFLVMLIIFFVAATISVQEEKEKILQQLDPQSSGLRVDLPAGESKDIEPDAASLVIKVPLEGSMFVDEKQVDIRGLDSVLQQAGKLYKDTQIIVMADKGVPHGRVVEVMEVARRNNLSRIALATE